MFRPGRPGNISFPRGAPYKVPVKNGKQRSVLGLVFLTVFLDIVGFSILFPLFPKLLEYYLGLEGPESAVGQLVSWLEQFARTGGGDTGFAVEALFGGLLGALYSGLQFLFAPVWGAFSDRHGRRPTLLLTLTGTLVAYVLWVFAGSFAILIASRILGGIMAGNISTASAVAADTTTGANRAKGMAIVGMAIGLGFVIGPALGALFVGVQLGSETSTSGFALHPFSGAALAATVLAAINLLGVATRLPETRPLEKRGSVSERAGLHPFKRLASLDFPGVKQSAVLNLIYLTAFSAMEFTLVFYALDVFDFGYGDQAKMFVFIGLVIAFVQGGFVRRMAPRIGEKKLVIAGVLATVPGFIITGTATHLGVFYTGLFLLAVGNALLAPCLSSLISRYSPEDRQGLVLGVFRSMGSLSRAIGPLLGGLAYWRLGRSAPYLAGAALLLLPLAMALGLPPVPPDAPDSEGSEGSENAEGAEPEGA